MGAGHLCKSQHNYTCNCVALSHHNLHGSSWARCARWSTASCAPPPSRRQPGWWSRGERIDCTPGSRSQLQPSARETCTELNPLLCHYLKTFWTNARISVEEKLFNTHNEINWDRMHLNIWSDHVHVTQSHLCCMNKELDTSQPSHFSALLVLRLTTARMSDQTRYQTISITQSSK